MQILLLLLIYFINTSAYAQNSTVFKMSEQVLYQLEYQPDSNDNSIKRKEVMELLINDNFSLFQTLKKGQWDSVILKNKNNPSFSPYRTEFDDSEYPLDYEVFKFPDKTLVAESYDLFASDYQYYQSTNEFDWELLPDTQVIANHYLVQKAALTHGGRQWTAWFCPSIPIPDGPYIFSGLPGLIFNMHDEKKYWSFTLLALQSTDREVEVDRDKFNKLMTKAKFFRSRADFILNQSQILKARGTVRFPSTEQFQEAVAADKKRAKKDNNWIELYP